MPPDNIIAFAPASVGNVAVGFDILGHAISGIGDCVTVSRSSQPGINITSISGCAEDLPCDAADNTATRGLPGLCDRLGIDQQFDIAIHKGIPLGSGIGGSAASAVAGVVALNEFLGAPLSSDELLPFAIDGESAAAKDVSADNVAPSLYGGLVLITESTRPGVYKVPVPETIRCVVIRPYLTVETRQARELLNSNISLREAVGQMGCLAGFLAGCFGNDIRLIGESLKDLLIEPQRKHLIPGFDNVQDAALASGALGCSISGSGPSVFAWCEEERARPTAEAMIAAFEAEGIQHDCRISPVEPRGARTVESVDALC